MNDRRYPIAPLVTALAIPAGASVTRALNISGTRLATYATYGIDERAAERLAVRVGLTPYEVWPEMLDQAIADLERICASGGCGERFVQLHGGPRKRFCSRTCKARENWRRRAAQGPHVARETKRRYRAEIAEMARKRAERRTA